MELNGILIYHLPQNLTEVAMKSLKETISFSESNIVLTKTDTWGLKVFFDAEPFFLKAISRGFLEVHGTKYCMYPLVTDLTVHGAGAYIDEDSLRFQMEGLGPVLFVYKEKRNHSGTFTDNYRVTINHPEIYEFIESWNEKTLKTLASDTEFAITFFCRFCRQNGHTRHNCESKQYIPNVTPKEELFFKDAVSSRKRTVSNERSEYPSEIQNEHRFAKNYEIEARGSSLPTKEKISKSNSKYFKDCFACTKDTCSSSDEPQNITCRLRMSNLTPPNLRKEALQLKKFYLKAAIAKNPYEVAKLYPNGVGVLIQQLEEMIEFNLKGTASKTFQEKHFITWISNLVAKLKSRHSETTPIQPLKRKEKADKNVETEIPNCIAKRRNSAVEIDVKAKHSNKDKTVSSGCKPKIPREYNGSDKKMNNVEIYVKHEASGNGTKLKKDADMLKNTILRIEDKSKVQGKRLSWKTLSNSAENKISTNEKETGNLNVKVSGKNILKLQDSEENTDFCGMKEKLKSFTHSNHKQPINTKRCYSSVKTPTTNLMSASGNNQILNNVYSSCSNGTVAKRKKKVEKQKATDNESNSSFADTANARDFNSRIMKRRTEDVQTMAKNKEKDSSIKNKKDFVTYQQTYQNTTNFAKKTNNSSCSEFVDFKTKIGAVKLESAKSKASHSFRFPESLSEDSGLYKTTDTPLYCDILGTQEISVTSRKPSSQIVPEGTKNTKFVNQINDFCSDIERNTGKSRNSSDFSHFHKSGQCSPKSKNNPNREKCVESRKHFKNVTSNPFPVNNLFQNASKMSDIKCEIKTEIKEDSNLSHTKQDVSNCESQKLFNLPKDNISFFATLPNQTVKREFDLEYTSNASKMEGIKREIKAEFEEDSNLSNTKQSISNCERDKLFTLPKDTVSSLATLPNKTIKQEFDQEYTSEIGEACKGFPIKREIDADKKSNCEICFQEYADLIQLPCHHVFCYLCVRYRSKQKRRCAICKQEFPSDCLDNPSTPSVSSGDSYKWFYEGSNGWWQYDDSISSEIEASFQRGERQYEVCIHGRMYKIYFKELLEVRKSDYSHKRRIKRDLEIASKKVVDDITRTPKPLISDAASTSLSGLKPADSSKTKCKAQKNSRKSDTSSAHEVEALIKRSKGVLKPNELNAFLKHVRNKKHPRKMAEIYSVEVDKITEQLDIIIKNYYRGVKRSSSDDTTIKWLVQLKERIKTHKNCSVCQDKKKD